MGEGCFGNMHEVIDTPYFIALTRNVVGNKIKYKQHKSALWDPTLHANYMYIRSNLLSNYLIVPSITMSQVANARTRSRMGLQNDLSAASLLRRFLSRRMVSW